MISSDSTPVAIATVITTAKEISSSTSLEATSVAITHEITSSEGALLITSSGTTSKETTTITTTNPTSSTEAVIDETLSDTTTTETTTTVIPNSGISISSLAPFTTSSPNTANSFVLPSTVPVLASPSPHDEGAILCTGVGIYPDPNDCRKYHYCSPTELYSWTQSCPPNYAFVYRPFTSNVFPCRRISARSSNCVKIDCSQNSLVTAYGRSKIFYAICYINELTRQSEAVMMKCSDGAQLDGIKCVYRCRREGLFVYSVNPAKYYQCYYSARKLVYRLLNCPNGKVFNESKKVCI
ncbi:uncharacterized protein LOC131687106 [Topomyia yanbarensis]|uniref:uncharacterized protein LOC131687106 n=1 Tax=Topomyia yanbarensis TaxID=2498891 RepID=UPI00273AEB5B|nr:uncharacterized protein LOC131687106 [Topomyia yanbarensis]